MEQVLYIMNSHKVREQRPTEMMGYCANSVKSQLPVIALLTRETLQMIYITPRPHDHLKCRNDLTASRTISSIPK